MPFGHGRGTCWWAFLRRSTSASFRRNFIAASLFLLYLLSATPQIDMRPCIRRLRVHERDRPGQRLAVLLGVGALGVRAQKSTFQVKDMAALPSVNSWFTSVISMPSAPGDVTFARLDGALRPGGDVLDHLLVLRVHGSPQAVALRIEVLHAVSQHDLLEDAGAVVPLAGDCEAPHVAPGEEHRDIHELGLVLEREPPLCVGLRQVVAVLGLEVRLVLGGGKEIGAGIAELRVDVDRDPERLAVRGNLVLDRLIEPLLEAARSMPAFVTRASSGSAKSTISGIMASEARTTS